ncbi:MAG: CvpA family protein [Firmicutes bacterium]|nr:CvpA family protein [Bacillota bacterium]
MDWFDLAALAFLGFFVVSGYRRGLVSQLVGMAGIVIALALAFSYFDRVGALLDGFLSIGPQMAGVAGFVLIVILVNLALALLVRAWRAATKSSGLSLLDSIGGAFFGGLKALFILVFIVVILVSLPIPALRQRVEGGVLTAQILRAAPVFYLLQERSLPPDVPRLLVTAEGVRLRRIDFAALDGATCLGCGGKVEYRGFVRKGLLSYPLFECPRCGLKSDGCLTYEGYHLFYDRCPLARADRGEAINCHVWPNPAPVVPKGPCPVCGRR